MKLTLRLAITASLLALALTWAATVAAEPAAAPTGAPSLALQVTDLTNQQRAASGLAPLQWNDTLAYAAAVYAQDMANRGYFSHFSPEGTTPVDRGAAAGYPSFSWGTYVGENLAMGFDSADAAMEAWMNSEGHRRNVLLPNYIETGVGIACAPDGTMYWAQEFGNRPLDYSPER